MIAKGTIIATASSKAAASTIQRPGPRRRRSCGAWTLPAGPGRAGSMRSTTAMPVVISDPLPALAGRLDADEDDRDDDDDDREHHRDGRPVADLRLREEVLVGEVRRDVGAVLRPTLGQHVDRTEHLEGCLLYTSPSPRDRTRSRMPSS